MKDALETLTQSLEKEPKPPRGRQLGDFMLSVEDCETRIESWKESFKDGGEREKMVPTLSSLAYDLGVASRTLADYQPRDAYAPMLARAKTFCEMHVEQILFDPSVRPAGPIFNLKANFGHKDGNEHGGNINFNFNWNTVQVEAAKRRDQMEGRASAEEDPIDLE